MSTDELFYEFPENYPLYKDSGLWQLRSDDMEEVIAQQEVNEPFTEFILRCKIILFDSSLYEN